MSDGFEDLSGEYSVEVSYGSDVVLTWSGYASNPSDALYHTINLRNEAIARMIREGNQE